MNKPEKILEHEFVEFIPSNMDENKLYVSIPYATVSHKCCCGCGQEVVSPLSPTDWKLIFDGQSISLNPSIGNWSFDCRSHYWIKNNRIIWAESWSQERVELGRSHDRFNKQRQYDEPVLKQVIDISNKANQERKTGAKNKNTNIWDKLTYIWPFKR